MSIQIIFEKSLIFTLTLNIFSFLVEPANKDNGHIVKGTCAINYLYNLNGRTVNNAYEEESMDGEAQVADVGKSLVKVDTYLWTYWKLEKWNQCRPLHEGLPSGLKTSMC